MATSNLCTSNDPESHNTSTTEGSKKGGWITFPFIAGGLALLTLGAMGITANLIVYLIEEFHIESIEAAQVFNALNGCNNFFPIIGAIVADSAFGCFKVASYSFLFGSMALLLVCLTAMIDSLRPPPCHATGSSPLTSSCEPPSKFQLAYLYTSIFISSLAISGIRFTTATLGADQFDKQGDRLRFFNWLFCAQYASMVLGSTAFVYIEDNVSWALGFGISVGSCVIASVIFVLGNRFYIHEKPQGSPFSGLARVIVATIRKWKLSLSTNPGDYYYVIVPDEMAKLEAAVKPLLPSNSLRAFNRAALKNEGDVKPDGSIAKPWKLCSVQQVEDLKSVLKLLPIWSTTMLLSTSIAIQNSMTILQALTLDRHLGPHFMIPAGSIIVLVVMTASVSLALINRIVYPMWKILTSRSMTSLQIMGVGHVSCVVAMIISAIVESRRLHMVDSKSNHIGVSSIIPMSVLWLFPQLISVGISEAFIFPGSVGLYYQEFPASMRTSATATAAVIIGIAYYLSTALVDQIRRITGWLPDDLNKGRLDNVFWVLTVITVLNFGYYLVCAMFYKYQNSEDGGVESVKPSHVEADAASDEQN